MDTTWSDRIKELEGLGWSLAGIAERIGLASQSVSDIKQGRSAEPRGMAAVKLYRLHQAGKGPKATDARAA
jgi:transcriptional regulator with XRE-family HTH domain